MNQENVISIRTRRPITKTKLTIVSTGRYDENDLEIFFARVEDGYGNVHEVEFTGPELLFGKMPK